MSIFSWPASRVEGQPVVYPSYGDIPGAWAPKVLDANQFIEVLSLTNITEKLKSILNIGYI